MAEVLELAQLAQDDGVAEVDVGRRRVEAELDAQRPSRARACAASAALGQAVDGVAGEEGGVAGRGSRHGANARVRRRPWRWLPPVVRSGAPGTCTALDAAVAAPRCMSDSERPDILGPRRSRRSAGRDSSACAWRSILLGLSLLALVSTAFGMMMAVASDLPELENRAGVPARRRTRC